MKYITAFLLLTLSAQTLADCVILLHGLARTERSMGAIEKALKGEGFSVVNVRYPSREATIETLATTAIAPALQRCPSAQPINFVTHSMGGILVRQYLSSHTIPSLHRVVMLGPPNGGSELADKLGAFPGFNFVNGEAGLQLGTEKDSLPNSLGKAEFNLGIIAGNKSYNWISSGLIPGADDGKVSVEKTRLVGMNDHLEMAVTHTFMMQNKKVIAQIIHYLKFGKFNRPDATTND